MFALAEIFAAAVAKAAAIIDPESSQAGFLLNLKEASLKSCLCFKANVLMCPKRPSTPTWALRSPS